LYISLLLLSFQQATGQDSSIIAIENINVIPMTEEIVLPKQRVIIANGKILRIESSALPLHDSVTFRIDGTDKYLIPSLSEMHYHFRSKDIESDFKLLIANGITTVRNMAETEEQDQIEIKKKTLSGALWPFNYFTAGPYLQAKDLQSPRDISEVVKRHKERGYDFLKIADNLPKSIYLKLLEECHKNNIPVVGHAQRALPLEYSLRMKSIEHIEEFVYLSKEGKGTAYSKQDATRLKELALQVKQSGVYIGTTLAVFDFITNCLDDKKFALLQKHGLTKYLAKDQRDGFLTEKNDYRKLRHREFDGVKAVTFFNNYFLWMKRFARILSDNNVPLLTGSDTYGMVIVGFSLHWEFELLQKAGLKPFDILLASTVNPARYLHTYSMNGTISEGKYADLVLLNKNPLVDINNTKAIEGVFLKGKWFDRGMLDTMLKEVEAAYK
ncbi:MAG TPA: amidohydrolase family protein, partial [Flavisolibacter sp.]|nr:amidohydrolase family protein [Flavisolibacter sp.]